MEFDKIFKNKYGIETYLEFINISFLSQINL